MKRPLLLLAAALAAAPVAAAEIEYEIDPAHTFPSFEADHMGISFWRGKFNASGGRIVLDKAAGTGTVEVDIDVASIDFGLDAMNDMARSAELFDSDAHPRANYRGTLAGFVDGAPTRVDGELTLRGITRPVRLELRRFKCIPHPLHGRELCGADAGATLQRDAFGIDAGKAFGFDMTVALRIQVEAIAVETGPAAP